MASIAPTAVQGFRKEAPYPPGQGYDGKRSRGQALLVRPAVEHLQGRDLVLVVADEFLKTTR